LWRHFFWIGALNDARDYHAAVWRLQEPELYDNQEQEEEPGPAGAKEILPNLSASYGPQGSQVIQWLVGYWVPQRKNAPVQPI
jgi:hypothetical protein